MDDHGKKGNFPDADEGWERFGDRKGIKIMFVK
jgi:hypothetical protein